MREVRCEQSVEFNGKWLIERGNGDIVIVLEQHVSSMKKVLACRLAGICAAVPQ